MVIIDTSVAFKWLVEEDYQTTLIANRLLQQFLRKEYEFLSPDIILYELGNVLAYKTGYSQPDLGQIWQKFQKIELPLYRADSAFIANCVVFSKSNTISVYDASFIVLAQMKGCDLVTADNKLVQKVNLPFVKLLGEGIVG